MARVDYNSCIRKVLKASGKKYQETGEGNTIFIFSVEDEETGRKRDVKIRIDFEKTMRIWSYLEISVPADKTTEMLNQINMLNSRYRYMKLYLDEDNDVCAEYEIILSGERADVINQIDIVLRLITSVLEIYMPQINKVVWNNHKEKGNRQLNETIEINLNPFKKRK